MNQPCKELWHLSNIHSVQQHLYQPSYYLWIDSDLHSPQNTFNISQFNTIAQTRGCTSIPQAESLISNSKQLFRIITSASLGPQVCARFQHLDNVIHIYVFCNYLPAGQTLKHKYSKVKSVTNNLEQCLKDLRENRRHDNKFKTLPNFIMISKEDRELVNVCRFNLHCLLKGEERVLAGNQFAQLAREIYPKDKDIDVFLKEYSYNAEKVFSWYTQECFYYKLLNNILRCSLNPLTVAYVRLPFIDVFKAIRQLYSQQKLKCKVLKKTGQKFYRGGWISEEQFLSLKHNQKGFIQIMGFLSTSKNKKIAEDFLKRNPNPNTRILYTVKVTNEDRLDQYDYGFADISEYSKYDEEQVLFNALNVFQISSVRVDNGLKRATLIYGSLATFAEKMSKGEQLTDDESMIVMNRKYQKQTINKMNDEGDLLQACQMYNEAISYKLQKLQIENSIDEICRIENSLGQCYQKKGLRKEAISKYTSALEKLSDESDLKALIYQNLGKCNFQMGNYLESADYCKKSLQLYKKCKGQSDIATANAYGNLGVTQQYLGRIQNSIELHRKAQDLCQKIVGEMHLATATSYNNLGSSLHHKGDYDAAIECYLKCISISELVLGLNNKDVATAYNNIGLSYHKKQLYNEAILYYEKALQIKTSKTTPNTSTAATYINLGLSYKSKGDYKSAVDSYQNALNLLTNSKQHPTVIVCYNNLAQCYQTQRKYKQAEQYYSKAAQASQKLSLIDLSSQRQLAQIYGNLGICLLMQGTKEQGIKSILKSLKSLEVLLGKQQCKTSKMYQMYRSYISN